jgi:DNA-binding FadR family transcriptional regulator
MLRFVPGPRLARSVSQAGHDPIVSAILAGDPAGAHAAVTRHVEGTYDWIVGLRLGLRA